MNTSPMPRKRKRDNSAPVPAKRTRRARSKRGILGNMPEMPLDILYMIFMYLVPMDMLNLARTAIVFRKFLMSSGSAPLWRTARLNIPDLPDCPSHLSEPQYANLAFDTHCHSCDKANVKTVFWALSVRYCPGCRKDRLVRCSKRLRYCSVGDTDLIAPVSEDASGSHHWHSQDNSLVDAEQHFNSLDDQGKEAQKLRVRKIMQWARECEVWNQNKASSRESELYELRQNRLQSTVAKLRDLGWAEELDRMHPYYGLIRNHPLIYQPRALTDRIWNNIRADVVELMASIQQRRVDAERHRVLKERCSNFQKVYKEWHAAQPDKRVLPRSIDLMRRPEVAALIMANNEVQISLESFRAFTHLFTRWATEWKVECDEKLRDLVRRSLVLTGGVPAGVDPLSLARVVFTCKKCKNESPSSKNVKVVPLYPTILTHDCLYEEVSECRARDALEQAAVAVSWTKSTFGNHTFWSCEPLEVDSWVARADAIVTAFGRDPMTVTRDEMDAAEDTRIYCRGCPLDSEYHRDVMTWRHALRHYAVHDSMNGAAPTGPLWARITDPHTLRVVRQKEVDFNKLLADEHEQFFIGSWYYCTHCQRGGLTPLGLFEHSEWAHGIDEPREQDFYRTPDSEMCLLRPTMLIHPSFREVMTDGLRQKIANGRATWFDFTASIP
ncbi:hypothetical protein PHLGIDRAFT_188921 [Phlebiopsis gigantea 11061_1 CR5-6]|uniref:F-box domain-containing protein n=1 Tax=Phlebiopsis gigantea (strain 11061_1 CR5-6) TaxID=745531 RepID=A0A0C3RUF1_PHLG1|nr:hypothetical protein PHLGIDRAFT_188921 [Phlebiopsis gigantea 11061_1 CR5-6]